MRRLGISLGILVLLATACGKPAEPAAPGAPGTPPPAATSPSTPVPPVQLDASALPAEFPKNAWVLGDGRSIAVEAQEGGCGKASAEATEQTADKVVIALVETTPRDAVACTMDIRYPILTVSLDKPLDGRTIVLRAEQRTK
jgi:hypothetical protein